MREHTSWHPGCRWLRTCESWAVSGQMGGAIGRSPALGRHPCSEHGTREAMPVARNATLQHVSHLGVSGDRGPRRLADRIRGSDELDWVLWGHTFTQHRNHAVPLRCRARRALDSPVRLKEVTQHSIRVYRVCFVTVKVRVAAVTVRLGRIAAGTLPP